MSFILDALKKSETERQQQGGGEFSTVPTSSAVARPKHWLWILVVLLAINLAVLLGILMRPDLPPAVPAEVDAGALDPVPVGVAGAETAADPATSFADQVADARQVQSAPSEAAARVTLDPAPTPAGRPPATPTNAGLQTIDELRLEGMLQLAELHLDIHVYNDDPAERFVFINMDKHREQSQLDEGPVVREITRDGVVLEYRGQVFLLPRE